MQENKNSLVAIILVLVIQFIVTFEMNVVMPLAPNIAALYGVASHQVTYLNIGFALFGMLAPIIGFNSDKVGIKKMIGFTLFLSFIGAMLIANIPSVIAYVVGRSLMGLAFFTMLGIGLSYISLLVSEDRLGVVSGLHRIAFGLGVFTSPLLGTFLLETLGFQSIYQMLAIVIAIATALFMFISPEVPSVGSSASLSAVQELIKGKKEKQMIIITFLMSLPAIFFFNYLSVYLSGQNVDAQMIASIYTTVALGSILGGFSIMFFSDKVGKAKMLIYVATLVPIVIISFYFSSGALLFLVGLLFGFLFDSATGLLFPVGSMLVHHYKATFLTILSLTMSFVNVISNIIGPTLYALGGFLLLIVIIAVGIFVAGIMLRNTTRHLI